ncbi:RICIN domain-containing protein [Kitasatospora sp. NPDC059327]|uniref:RICIN domain-containing protein n=1 Tax=Kitasatospora sp. NPDC059327 TaxID=3346803 RepID=UPI0036788EFC
MPVVPAAGAAATMPAASTGSVGDPGPAYTFAARHSGKCLTIPQGDLANAVQAEQRTCVGGLDQQWRLEDAGAGYVSLVAQHSGRCLTVRGASTADAAAVEQDDCTGTASSQWKLDDRGNAAYRLVARHSGKCLNVQYGAVTDGARFIQWPCGTAGNEQFTRTLATTQVVTWAASTDRLGGNAVQDRTYRLIVRTSTGGSAVRIRLSNAFGTQPVTFGDVRMGLRSSGAAVASGSNRPLTFGGATSVTVPAGGTLYSDPLGITVGAGSDLAVSLYVQRASGTVTGHDAAMQTSYVAPQGNHAGGEAGAAFTQTVTSWFYLDAVVADAPAGTGAVAALGDSITDGWYSTRNANRRWPDVLAARLQSAPGNLVKGVANEGIVGNRVLQDGRGESAVKRLRRDVLSQRGLRTVILLEGVNDILNNVPSSQDLIDGYRDIVGRAHTAGVCVVGATILPFGGWNTWTAAGEQIRQEANAFIRNGGLFDAVVDFDAVVRDPAQPSRMLPAYDSGDRLHPSDAGMRAMGEAVNLDSLRCTR